MNHFLYRICGLLRKSACLVGHVETKIYLPESHFFKSSLARASRLVLMSDPGMSIVWIMILNLSLGPVDDAVKN